jgi:hypothetical protein
MSLTNVLQTERIGRRAVAYLGKELSPNHQANARQILFR